jgi:hypothetical protein
VLKVIARGARRAAASGRAELAVPWAALAALAALKAVRAPSSLVAAPLVAPAAVTAGMAALAPGIAALSPVPAMAAALAAGFAPSFGGGWPSLPALAPLVLAPVLVLGARPAAASRLPPLIPALGLGAGSALRRPGRRMGDGCFVLFGGRRYALAQLGDQSSKHQ